MGVRGLTTYVKVHEDIFLRYHLLHDTDLVIDGYSLCCQLLNNMNAFWAFGGDYDRYVVTVKRFFQSLRKCNINAYVLFDGCYETRKIKTAYRRLKAKLNGASQLNPVTQSSLQIFPLLVFDVFREVLSSLGVPYTICEFEADDEIAAMARYLKCPVLSYDSDFYIYNVLYVPFDNLKLVPKQFEVDGKKFYALQCKLYKVEYLLQHFGGLKEELLPLLATLLGNDFVEKKVFKQFFSQLKLPNSRNKSTEQQRSIQAVFKWLEHENLESAIPKILGRVKKYQRHRVFSIIKQSIEGYNRRDCKSLAYFDIKESDVSPKMDIPLPYHLINVDNDSLNNEECDTYRDVEDEKESSSSESEGTESSEKTELEEKSNVTVDCLPEWVSKCIRQGFIPPQYLNLYAHHLYFCFPQAEDYDDNDAFICVLPLLKYAFDILTNFSGENFMYVCREKQNYKRIIIGEEYSIAKPSDIDSEILLQNPRLSSYFLHFLTYSFPSLNLDTLEILPANFQLFMLSILWWVSKCKVSNSYIYSLLLCYVMLEVIDEKTGSFRGHHFFNNKYSNKLKDLRKRPVIQHCIDNTKLLLNKNKVLYEDSLVAASVLLQHFELSDVIKKRPRTYDSKRVHHFAQFQCCLQQFNCLNVLCRNKYERTNYGKSFNGTFVYNMCTKLEKHIDPLKFINEYLADTDTVLWFFKSLLFVYDKCIEQLKISVPKGGNVTGKKKKHRINNEEQMSFLNEEFKSEVVI